MKTISIRELHERTGRWVREACRHAEIQITDHGRPVAALRGIDAARLRDPWPDRRLRAGFERARKRAGGGTASEGIVATMRARSA